MRIDLPPDASLHVARGLDVSLRGDDVHVRPRHRAKVFTAALLSVALSGLGGFVVGSWDKIAEGWAEAGLEGGANPASLQVPVNRPSGMRNAAAGPTAPPQARQTVVAPPPPSAGQQADPFGLVE